MKRAWIVLVLALIAGSVSAGNFGELQVVNGKPTVDLYVAGKIHGKIGWSAFSLVNKDWAQVYAGPTFAPTSWSEISANIGVETGGTRFAESLWLGHGRFSMLAINEHGFSGHWHKITADWNITKSFTIGYHGQALVGNGPRISYTRGKVAVWGSLLFKDGETNTIVAMKISP